MNQYLDKTPVDIHFTLGELRAVGSMAYLLQQVCALDVIAPMMEEECRVALSSFSQKLGTVFTKASDQLSEKEKSAGLDVLAGLRAEIDQRMAEFA